MRVLFLLGALLASISATLTAPNRRQETKASFSLEATKAYNGKPDFVREWVAAHQKWGKGVSPEVAKMFSLADDNGVVEADPLPSDSIYIADIQIGNPPQTVKLAMDTGSSDLWTQSSDTVWAWNYEGPWPPLYKANLSRTSRRIPNAEWDISYVDGSGASGIVYLDTLRMGGFELHDMSIQSAKFIHSRFEGVPEMSGILGLAKSLPNNIVPDTPTLLEKLRPLLAAPVFSVDLRRNATGYFDFGHIDETKALGNLSWMETNPESPHWDVSFDLTRWEGSHANTWWYYKFNATIDTGTTLIFLPKELASLYWYNVPGMRIDPRLSDAFSFPCNIADGLPDLFFKIPGTEHELRIPGPYLNFGPTVVDPEYCWGGMQSAEDMDVTLFGATMLKALYLAFDLDQGKVGFANKPLDDVD